ncbi:hypothetical protein [Muribaculum gordoncarteri]|uniref:hypothetical protein n=1 Tax=Muribaculum gordoncarteri TaxID=2530390 RepID=UPI003F66C8FA
MAAGIMGVLLFVMSRYPTECRRAFTTARPMRLDALFPMMFVSIAVRDIGIPCHTVAMMARCLKNEKLARPVFYGAMVAEGIVALIWQLRRLLSPADMANLANTLPRTANRRTRA